MPEEEKPLPKPPSTPFGRKRRFEGDDDVPLLADQMAMAMAEGKLDEFLKNNIPDNEHARALSMMMLGMTGIAPPPMPDKGSGEGPGDVRREESPQEVPEQSTPPGDVLRAVGAGDVNELMGLLEREYRKRNPTAGTGPTEATGRDNLSLSDTERETLDQLTKIATEHKVSLDWVVLRALRLYVQDYEKTGRL